jgi:Ran GTPase-activating protein (RanGAP) involved in mRNA processing and transport
MSVSNDSTVLSTIDDGEALLSSAFLECCARVRNSDPSILPERGRYFNIRHSSEKEDIELADALLENTNVTHLQFNTNYYTKSAAEAMTKYVRTSKRLQRIRWNPTLSVLQQCQEMLSYFLTALQESTSLKELSIDFPIQDGPSNLAIESMLTHTQSLRSLTLICPDWLLEDTFVAAARSGLKKNTTLRELTLETSRAGSTVSPILTSLCDHPLLRKLCLRGDGMHLTGLENVLLSDTSKITELDIQPYFMDPPFGLRSVLCALARHPTLTKLGLHGCLLTRDEVRLLRFVLCNIPCLQSLDLGFMNLGSAGLAELEPVFYHNTSIKVLDISGNNLIDMESVAIFHDILRGNKTMTTLDLSRNQFGRTIGAGECIADGLGSNSTLLKIDLSSCCLEDGGLSSLAQAFGSRNTTLQKLAIGGNAITSTGVGVLLETMDHITDLDIGHHNRIGSEGASLLATALGNNALPNLTRLTLWLCDGDDGFTALVLALKQNTSLLYLNLQNNYGFSERAFWVLAESLPEIKVLQQANLTWCKGIASAMPLLLAGLRKNLSLFRFHVAGCTPSSFPPTPEETIKCAGGWMQEMERLGQRNRFIPLIRAPEGRLPPRGVWPRALASVATLPDVIFEVLRFKPNLVPSEDTEDKEAAKDTGVQKKRKRIDY